MKYLDYRHGGKALYAPTILTSVELLPFIFCFCIISIINPDTMYIITSARPFQSGCT